MKTVRYPIFNGNFLAVISPKVIFQPYFSKIYAVDFLK
jgi:hypothetical protein